MLSFARSFVSFGLCEWASNDLLEAQTYLLCFPLAPNPLAGRPCPVSWNLRKKETQGYGSHLCLKLWYFVDHGVFASVKIKNCTKISCIRLPWWLSGKESAYPRRRHGFDPWSQEHPSCRGTTKSIYHNYWACALESENCNYWSLLA